MSWLLVLLAVLGYLVFGALFVRALRGPLELDDLDRDINGYTFTGLMVVTWPLLAAVALVILSFMTIGRWVLPRYRTKRRG